MKKITLLLSVVFVTVFGFQASAQFSCDTAVALTDGFTAMGITTPGTGGVEDWNDPNPTNSCASNAFYWDDDVYLFEYTAGADDEEISMTIFTRNGWNGIGIFSDCTGTALDGCLSSANSVGGGVSQDVLANVGAGVTVYIAIGQWGAPDNLDFDVTAFTATALVDPPSCSVVTSPADGAIDVLEIEPITWSQATGGATGYYVTIGTTSGGNDVLDNFDVGNVLTYTPSPVLEYSTEYFVTITAYNSNGDSTGCLESSFTLRDAPPTGSTCGNPIAVTTPLPYTTDDDTINYGDDYSGAAGTDCGSGSGYLNGDDVVYSYSPATDTSIDIGLSNLTDNYAGVFVYTDCADIGTQCATGAVNGFSSDDILIDNFTVTGGQTYYIVISTWAAPQNVGYTLTITENTCVDSVATYDVRSDCENTPQFFVDVDVTDLGSAGTVTVSDDQGSTPQTISVAGLVSFGPFANSTPVVVTVANDDDSNCTLVSGSLTQDYCFDSIVDCTVGPINTIFCYYDDIDDDPSLATFTYTSSDGSSLNFTINDGQMEGCCDELVIIDSDGTELYNQNIADPSGITFQSSGDTISWYINSDGSVNCEDNGYTPFDVTVACATCVNPVVAYDVRSDCAIGAQFYIDVDVTDLGTSATLDLTDDQGSALQSISAAGVVSFGPFANNTPVVITISNDDVNCELTSTALTQEYCLDNIVDCNAGPVNTTFCYFDDIDDDPSIATFTYTSSNGLPLNFVINDGQMEGCCDELVIIDSDGTELFNENVADPSGITFQSSGDTISWYINSDGSVNCQENGYTPFDVTVSCATCINPAATYQVVDDCDNGDQFLIDVNITTLGDATSLTISNNIDATTVPVTAIGVYQIGPFPFLVDVIVTTSNDQDGNCVINSSAIQLLACPPENDNPCNASTAVVNSDTTCDLVTSGSIIEATPSGVPDGTCGGDPDDDVWFEFVAEDVIQVISIINIQGGTTNLDHGVYEGDCGSLTELFCSDDEFSFDDVNYVVGNTYFIRVFSGGSNPETSTFDLCIRSAPANIDCENAENPCISEGTDVFIFPSVIGIEPGPEPNDVACLGSAPNPSWFQFEVGESGIIEFEIEQWENFDDMGNPEGDDLDVDFVLWGPFTGSQDYCTLDLEQDCPTCPFSNITTTDFYPFQFDPDINIVDCSFDGSSFESFTIDNAIAGEIYVLLVTNWSRDPGFIQMAQVNSGGGFFTAEIDGEIGYLGGGFIDTDGDTLGDLINVCDDLSINPSITLTADSAFADTYQWYKDGFEIVGEISSTLVVTESNTYQVIVFDDGCGAEALSQIVEVNFYNEATANTPSPIITCDDPSADGFEDFPLSDRISQILGSQDPSDFTVTFYENMTDANLGNNPLPLNFTNTVPNFQTIFVRVEDNNAAADGYLQCRDITQLDLVISGPTPTITSGVEYPECDDDFDGVTLFDLNTQDGILLGTQNAADYNVTYHITLADAEDNISPIDTTSLHSSTSTTIFVRIESVLAFDCYSTESLELVVEPLPDTSFASNFDYEVCPNASTPIMVTATANNYSESDVTINWYHDSGLISGEHSLSIPVLEAGLYEIEVINNQTLCYSIVSQVVVELPTCVIPQGISPNGDEYNQNFDLSSYDVSKLEIYNRNGLLVYSKKNYTNEWHGQSDGGDELPVGTYFYTMEYQNGKQRAAWIYIQREN